jgi:predicted DsbA family dithiol-disulfide isomerase
MTLTTLPNGTTTAMTRPTVNLDFISDIACPWCAVGLAGLEKAIDAVRGDIDVVLRFQPFELNPTMPPEGQDAAAHLKAKYGLSAEQLQTNVARIAERGRAVGFIFGKRERIWGTFDAHRLLAWAAAEGGAAQQHQLKRALLQAYHGDGQNPGDHAVLLRCVAAAGLSVDGAQTVLQGEAYALEVRMLETQWQQSGITAVPAVVVNDQYVIAGGQTPEMYERALRQIVSEVPADAEPV